MDYPEHYFEHYEYNFIEKTINYNNFISEKKILHTDNVNNYTDALIFFMNNKNIFDIITFNNIDKILLNINFLKKDKNNNYYYEYLIPRIGDIIDNIDVLGLNYTEINYYINDYEYKANEFDEFIFIAAPS